MSPLIECEDCRYIFGRVPQPAVLRMRITVYPIAPETTTRVLCQECADWLKRQVDTEIKWIKRGATT